MTAATRILIGGAPEGFDARLLAREAEAGPVIHIARDDRRLAAMRAALAFMAPDLPVLDLPAWDCLPYDRVSPNPGIAARRMATLAALARGLPGSFVLLTTLNAATQRLPAPETVAATSFSARVGDRVPEGRLREFLARMGFVPATTVAEPGDCAIRGGIVDIYAPGTTGPVRLDFFGDQLDGIRRFDAETQRTVEKLSAVEFAPVSEVMLDPASITRFRQSWRLEFGTGGAGDPVYEAVSAGRRHQGMEHWLPFFHERLATVFDYLPGAAVMLDDGTEARRADRWRAVEDAHAVRQEAAQARGRIDSPYRPCPPGMLYLDDAAWIEATAERRVLQLSPLPQPPGPGCLDAGGRAGRSFAPERQREDVNLFEALAEHLEVLRKDRQVVMASWSEGARERLAGILADHGVQGAKPVRDIREVPQGAGGLFLALWTLETGFTAPGLAVISEQDVLGERLVTRPRKRKAENFLRDLDTIQPGDLVVHVEHGVGRYRGIETIAALGAPHACLALDYAENARLFLPVENLDLLSRYGAEEGELDRLGGGAWQARKARLRQRIRDMADRLLRVAAERATRHAPVLSAPHGAWEEFAARFPWQETEDQLAAIADVMDDLGKGTPMDRLVVGDVGFGKTEVAMRAAFAAVLSGRQVAVVCPTTLLARQHFRTFADRFRGFPVTVRPLSRFVSAREASATRAGLTDGSVDIVVGTHALLGKEIAFRDLGLLVVDEEQHFGVAHKERLKELRADVHVLTLSATPIPRTLQLALTGVRDLSIIATPPVDRLAIRTYVSEFDTVTIREALLRERARGGQSFFVVPRIADLPEMEDFLRREVPELSVIVAHGQLAASELDRRMNDFYDGKADVLLATTIIESGLDIPTANTMVIHRADMFGLAQLYQLRGRVGRAKARAYCYLTTRPRMALTPQAERRLRTLASLDTLGAGFTLASHDLDARGAGNLLGEEQSGHIREVGYELYQQMLQETIARLRAGQGAEAAAQAEDAWSPVINLGVPVMIPEDYVPDTDLRLALYRRLSGLSSKVELEGFAAELIDRFGKLPKEVNTLLAVMRIKAMCRKAGIARLDAGPKGATVQFHRDRFADPAALVAWIGRQGPGVRVAGPKLVFSADWSSEAERIRGAFAIARDLAGLVRPAAAQGGVPAPDAAAG